MSNLVSMRITLLKIFIQILILLAVSGCIIPQSWLVNDPIDDHFHPGINVDTQVDHFSPVANNDAATIDFETPTIINVVANDTDPQSSTFTVVSNTAATSGALVDNGDGTITYTPNANFSGTDSFTYTIQNSFGLNATATVNLTVLSYCATFTQIAAVPFTGAPKAYAPLPDGTAPKPYLLCTKAQLDTIAADNTLWDTENYKLMQDIDMDNGGANNGIIGTTANNFTGVFDGNNFTI